MTKLEGQVAKLDNDTIQESIDSMHERKREWTQRELDFVVALTCERADRKAAGEWTVTR